jgi:hypothetical protein
LVVGYRTRIATGLSFLLVTSLDIRNVLVLSYADTLFSLLLFWALFLPLGERWSIDAARRDRPPKSGIASLASALILLQVVLAYFVNAVHKSGNELWTSGEAMLLVLSLEDMTYLLGPWLRAAPSFLEFGGLAWYYLLWFSPFLLVLVGRSRALYVAALFVGHLLLAVTVRIGAFPFVSIAGLMLFIQAPTWTDARKAVAAIGRRWSVPVSPGDRLPVACRSLGRRLEGVLPRFPSPTLPDRLWGPRRYCCWHSYS